MKYWKKNQIVESVQKLVHFPWSNWFDKITNSQTTKTTTDKQTNKTQTNKQTNKRKPAVCLILYAKAAELCSFSLLIFLLFCLCLFVCLFFYFLKVSECFYETNYREIMMNKNQKTYRPLRIHRSLPYFLFQYTETFANLHNTSRCA